VIEQPREHVIFVTLAGSHAHGTAGPHSDIDLRGICIAPLRTRLSYREPFEQIEGSPDPQLLEQIRPRLEAHPTASASLGSKIESVVFELAKFIRLCAGANPNALEILFADERDWLFAAPAWHVLHDRRREFLSLKVQQTYTDYALSQLKRIRTHRAWLMHPPARRPERGEFGLPDQPTLSHDDRVRIEQAVAQRIDSWGLGSVELPRPTRIALEQRLRQFWMDALHSTEDRLDDSLAETAARSLGLSHSLIAALAAEKRYRAAVKHWDSYQEWKARRNPARAELEAQFGYDTKHAMHLMRLMRTGRELLELGDLKVRRDDAKELAAIRDGGMSYDELLDHAEQLRTGIDEARRASSLPPNVDPERIDALLYDLIVAAERGRPLAPS
jgi:uncharacterized protein